MSNANWIVVEDPTGEWWEGALVDESRQRQLESRGVVLLPVIPDLFRRSGVGGFHKRAWGAGWPMHDSSPRTVAPLTLYCASAYNVMYWAARLVPDAASLEKVNNDEKEVFKGFIRFISDASQANPNKCGLQPLTQTSELTVLDKRTLTEGGFIIRGDAKVTVPGDGHYGFALYGTAPGLRVQWVAATQAAE